MSLRAKILLLVVLLTGLQIGVLYALSGLILWRGLNSLQDDQVRESTGRAVDAMGDALDQISLTAHDWSAWDDSYTFALDRNQGFIDSNLTSSALKNIRVHCIAFVDPSGRLAFSRCFSPENWNEVPFPPELAREIAQCSPLLRHMEPNSQRTGVLLTSYWPLLLASRPIVTSLEKGPIHGTLIMGRFLDRGEVGRIADLGQLSLSVFRADKPDGLPGFREFGGALSTDRTVIRREGKDTSAGYAVLDDLRGRPAVVLRVAVARTLFDRGVRTTRAFLLALLAVNTLFGALMFAVLEKQLIGRLLNMSEDVRWITGAGTTALLLVRTEGKDEVSDLGRNINALLKELREAHGRLQSSEELFKSLFENAVLGLYRTTPDGEILMANPAQCRMLGYASLEDLRRRNLEREGFHSSYPRSEFKRRLEEEGIIIGLESAWTRNDGSFVYVRESARPVKDDAGRTLYYDGTVEDISERKRAEEALLLEKQRLNRALSAGKVALWEWGLGEETRLWTSNAESMLGLDPGQLSKGVQGWESRVHTEDWPNLAKILDRHLREGAPYETEYRIRRADGTYCWWRDVGEAERNDAGRPFRMSGTCTDVTEQLALRERVREQEKLAAIGGIAMGIAHEVKNPLFAISSGIQVLMDELTLDEGQKRTFEIIYEVVMRMDRLVRQLLLFSSNRELKKIRVPVPALVREVITVNRGLLLERSLGITESFGSDLPEVPVDLDQIHQILLNLFQNAISVSPLDCQIEVSAEAAADRASVTIKVRDHGPGIPDKLREKIFEPFFTTKVGSSGMGLAISRRIAQDHGGSLTAESHPEGGAVFVLKLPAEVPR